jgi:type III pantothenate kinase
VVPLLTPIFLRVARTVSARLPLEVTPPGYGLKIDYPAEMLGADRFVNALAAWHLVRGAVVVADVGTTATVDAVADGTFLGGAIAPGPHFLVQALAQGTARLPQVLPVIEPWTLGKTTQGAIRAGVGHGFVGMVSSLIEKTRSVIGEQVPVVMTGGWATRIMPYLNFPVQIEPRLTLEGLRHADAWVMEHQG